MQVKTHVKAGAGGWSGRRIGAPNLFLSICLTCCRLRGGSGRHGGREFTTGRPRAIPKFPLTPSTERWSLVSGLLNPNQ